jgi:hypothetical protein
MPIRTIGRVVFLSIFLSFPMNFTYCELFKSYSFMEIEMVQHKVL